MKLFRRPPAPDPADRLQALARLTATPRPKTARPASVANTWRADEPRRDNPATREAIRRDNTAGSADAGRDELARRAGAGPDREVGSDEEVGGDEHVRGGWIPDSAVPDRLRGSRWALSPRHVAVVAIILLVGLAWALWSVIQSQPEPVPTARPSAGLISGAPVSQPGQPSPTDQPPPGEPSPPGQPWSPGQASPGQPSPGQAPQSPAASPGGPPSQPIVVHVAGKVRRPGLVRTTAGARVADVVEAAGGALPGVDLTGLNLARQVTDGEQILVGVPTTTPPSTPSRPVTPGVPAGGGQVDLNTATAAQLEALPGVGPVLPQRIVDWRTEHGRFTSVDELQEVTGVGEKKFESLKPHVRV